MEMSSPAHRDDHRTAKAPRTPLKGRSPECFARSCLTAFLDGCFIVPDQEERRDGIDMEFSRKVQTASHPATGEEAENHHPMALSAPPLVRRGSPMSVPKSNPRPWRMRYRSLGPLLWAASVRPRSDRGVTDPAFSPVRSLDRRPSGVLEQTLRICRERERWSPGRMRGGQACDRRPTGDRETSGQSLGQGRRPAPDFGRRRCSQ